MTRIFRHKFPLLCQMPSHPGSNTNAASTNVIIGSVLAQRALEDPSGEGALLQDKESVQEGIGDSSYGNNMNYVFALGRCSQLCKTAGHDKVALASVVSLVDEATERLRRGLHITPIYTNVASIGVQPEKIIYCSILCLLCQPILQGQHHKDVSNLPWNFPVDANGGPPIQLEGVNRCLTMNPISWNPCQILPKEPRLAVSAFSKDTK
jgi:hypothetical protein